MFSCTWKLKGDWNDEKNETISMTEEYEMSLDLVNSETHYNKASIHRAPIYLTSGLIPEYSVIGPKRGVYQMKDSVNHNPESLGLDIIH